MDVVHCGFEEAWIGTCQHSNPCPAHANLVCCVCSAPATKTCPETSSLVCGYPLCNDCEHETSPDGTNGFNQRHCRKADQKFLPWYARGINIVFDNCGHIDISDNYTYEELSKGKNTKYNTLSLPADLCRTCKTLAEENIV